MLGWGAPAEGAGGGAVAEAAEEAGQWLKVLGSREAAKVLGAGQWFSG